MFCGSRVLIFSAGTRQTRRAQRDAAKSCYFVRTVVAAAGSRTGPTGLPPAEPISGYSGWIAASRDLN